MITITVQDRQVTETLQRLLARLADLTPAMRGIGMELESAVSDRFETKTDPSGATWAPWAKSTRRRYPDDGNGTLLDRYGDMLDSLNHQADQDSVSVGFGMPYAAYHEWGTRKMPRRGLLTTDPDAPSLGDEDARRVLEILETFLVP